jgi:hypothetical protein
MAIFFYAITDFVLRKTISRGTRLRGRFLITGVCIAAATMAFLWMVIPGAYRSQDSVLGVSINIGIPAICACVFRLTMARIEPAAKKKNVQTTGRPLDRHHAALSAIEKPRQSKPLIATLATFFLVLVTSSVIFFESRQDKLTSEQFWSAFDDALKDPATRKKFQRALASQPAEVHSEIKRYIDDDFARQLPMRINANEIWTSIRTVPDAIHLTIEIPDEFKISNTDVEKLDNFYCSNPINVMLMLMGYEQFINYYSYDGLFIERLTFDADKCGL